MIEVEAPSIPPVVGGLLATVTPTDLPVNPTEGVTHDGPLTGITDFAPEPEPIDPEDPEGDWEIADKVFTEWGDIQGDPFTIYRGLEVNLFRATEVEGRLNEAFGLSETYAVERGFAQKVLAGATDVTPTGGISKAKHALGFLEQWAAENIVGRPTFHTDRFGAIMLDPEQDGDRLVTKQGTPIVNGGGYRMSAQPSGTFRIYATGSPALWRGPVISVPAIQYKQNRALRLIERQYVGTAGATIAYVTVTPTLGETP